MTEGDLTWPLAENVGATWPSGLSAAQKTQATDEAVDWLWALSGRVYGVRDVSYRPQTRVSRRWLYDPPSFLVSIFGPRGFPYGGCDPVMSDNIAKSIVDLAGPVVQPVTGKPVTVDIYAPTTGTHTALSTDDSPSLIRVEGDYLVRQDGNFFPETQNMLAAIGQPNTWQINYVRGLIVPAGGQKAATFLAVEIAKRMTGDNSCRLPKNTTTVSRASVTIQRDASKSSGATMTGVREVDDWIQQVNPNNLAQAPAVWSPDLPRNNRPFAGSYAPTN